MITKQRGVKCFHLLVIEIQKKSMACKTITTQQPKSYSGKYFHWKMLHNTYSMVE